MPISTGDDGLDTTGRDPSARIPPVDARMLAEAERAIADAQAAHLAAIGELLTYGLTEIETVQSAIDTDVAQLIGRIDVDLRGAASAHFTAITKVMDNAFRGLYGAQYELTAVGVSVPTTPEQVRIDLADETGANIIARLQGQQPAQIVTDISTAPQAIPVGAVEYPPPEPIPEPRPVPVPVPVPEPIPAPRPIPVPVPVPVPPGPVPMPVPVPPAPVPVPVPVPPAPVPPGGVTSIQCPAPVVECPAPPAVNVTVNVPPHPPGAPQAPAYAAPPPKVDALPIDQFFGTQGFGLVWAAPDVCKKLEEASHPKSPLAPGADAVGNQIPRREINSLSDLGDAGIDAIKRGVKGLNSIFPGGLSADSLASVVGDAASWLTGTVAVEPVMSALNPLSVPEPEPTARLLAKLGLAGFAQDRTKIPLDYLMQTERYLLQYLAPMYIPEQTALDNAYLHDVITAQQWTCLSGALGNIVECAKWGVDAQQTRPGVGECIDLYLRGHLPDEKALMRRLRQLGVLDDRHREEWLKLAQWIPQMPDIVRFLVRDTFDQVAVDRAKLDTDFEQKFYGGPTPNPDAPAMKLLRQIGVTPDMARLFWRAHWELPSPTQIYQMLHRLRPDRPEVYEWERAFVANGQSAEWAKENPRPLTFTVQEARDVLEQNDLAPAFIDHVMAMSFNPMTRTDCLTAFGANVMDAAELEERLIDTGLDRATAHRTVQLQEAMRARRTANVSGVWTVRKVARAYSRGSLDWTDAMRLLEPLMPDTGQRTALLSGVDKETEAALAEKKIDRARRAYFTGATSELGALTDLKRVGVSESRAVNLVAQWTEDRDGRYKEPVARMVLDWLKYRVITTSDALARLRQLGYTEVDANYMLSEGLKVAEEKARTEKGKLRAEVNRIISDEKKARTATQRELTAREQEIARERAKLDRELARIKGELSDRLGGDE